jgi:hypothetical protein
VPRTQLDVRGGARFDGHVGIGTGSPTKLLEISSASGIDNSTPVHFRITNTQEATIGTPFTDITKPAALISYYTPDTSTAGAGDVAGIGFRPESTLGGDTALCFYTDSDNADYNALQERMCITHEGLVGIGTTNPDEKFCVHYNSYTFNKLQDDGLHNRRDGGGDVRHFYFISTSGKVKIYSTGTVNATAVLSGDGTWTSFTGAHHSKSETNDPIESGMIVSSVGRYIGEKRIDNSLPYIKKSTVSYDKSCYGVLKSIDLVEEDDGDFYTGEKQYIINSIGEGALWVTNINGSLESGDYITTSNVAGYGMKQDSEFLANYTVAKITMDCDFNPPDIPVQRILKEKANVTYWYQLETVDLATWSNLMSEQRRTETETYYTVDDRVQVYGYVDEQSNVFIPPAHDVQLYTKTQQNIITKEVYDALPLGEQGNYTLSASNTYTYTQTLSLLPEVWTTLGAEEQNTYVHGYYNVVTKEVDSPAGAVERTRPVYQKVVNETKTETEGYLSEVRSEWVNVLDEHGQLQWEDVPTGETEPAYKVRYLDANGGPTTRHNAVYIAAFVGCTYHCG